MLGHVWDTVCVHATNLESAASFTCVPRSSLQSSLKQHRDDRTSVHITQPVLHRKGVWNMSFVFTYDTAHLNSLLAFRRLCPHTTTTNARCAPASQVHLSGTPPRERNSALGPKMQTGGATALMAPLWDEDDFDGRLNTRMWNRMDFFLCSLSLICASAHTFPLFPPASTTLHLSPLAIDIYQHPRLLRHAQPKALGFPLR